MKYAARILDKEI